MELIIQGKSLCILNRIETMVNEP